MDLEHRGSHNSKTKDIHQRGLPEHFPDKIDGISVFEENSVLGGLMPVRLLLQYVSWKLNMCCTF